MSRIIHRNQPQTPCAGRDEDLLMYLHGALPPVARIRTARHVHRCAACQQRLVALTATSQALADTVRGDSLPRWTPPTLPITPVWIAGGAAVLLLALISFITVSLWTQNVQAHTSSVPMSAAEIQQCRNAEIMMQHYRQFYAERAAKAAKAAILKKTAALRKAYPNPAPVAQSVELSCPIEAAYMQRQEPAVSQPQAK